VCAKEVWQVFVTEQVAEQDFAVAKLAAVPEDFGAAVLEL
jgi:hypothetical protein